MALATGQATPSTLSRSTYLGSRHRTGRIARFAARTGECGHAVAASGWAADGGRNCLNRSDAGAVMEWYVQYRKDTVDHIVRHPTPEQAIEAACHLIDDGCDVYGIGTGPLGD